MFFCPNCSNSYDITKPSADQTGGAEADTITTVSTTQSAGGDMDDLVNRIMEKEDIGPNDVVGVQLDSLKKVPAYKKLNKKWKEFVYNKISDQIPKNKKIKSLDKDKLKRNLAFFKCTNCGHMQQIKDGTKIYSRSFGVDDQYHINRVNPHRIESNVLLRTRRYNCPNVKCLSHKDDEKREAVIYRIGDSYMVGYSCVACNANWLN